MQADQPLFSFPHVNRIVTGEEYSAVRRRGRRLETRHFVVYVTKSECGHSRLGVIVSRKVGSAVVRSRCKRLAREAFRMNRPYLPADLDLVVIVKPGVGIPEYGEHEAELLQAIGLFWGRLSRG